MVTVYAIKSLVNGNIYVGMSTDADLRLKQHNAGKTASTKRGCPWTTIYRETQPDWATARIREKYLKSGAGKEFLKALVP